MRVKKGLALLCALGILWTGSAGFADPSEWAREGYFSMRYEGMASEDLLDPDRLQQAITREEFAELTVRLYAKAEGISTDLISEVNPFDDTDNPFVAKAYNVGIVGGVGEGKFAPANKVTRQEMAVMLHKELKKLGADTPAETPQVFADENAIADWASEAVDFCVSTGILSGVGNNRFAPGSNATREQALVMIGKTAQQYGWTPAYTPYGQVTLTTLSGLAVPHRNETQVTIYAPSSVPAVLRMESSGVADFGVVLDMVTQHRQLVGVIENDEAFQYEAASALQDQLVILWDDVQRQYNLDDDVYITDSGVVLTKAPLSGAYLHLHGVYKLVVDVYH